MKVRAFTVVAALAMAAAACSVAASQAAIEADNGVVVNETPSLDQAAVDTVIAPVDEIFYFHELGRESTVVRMGAERFDQTRLLEYEEGRHSYSVSPDGRTVAFVRRDALGHASIYLLDADGSNERLLVENVSEGGQWSRDGTRLLYTRDQGDGVGLRMITFDRESNEDRLVLSAEQLTGAPGAFFGGLREYEWGNDDESVLFRRRSTESTTLQVASFSGGIRTV